MIAEDYHRKTSLILERVIPSFVKEHHPKFVEVLQWYYKFLEQIDELPMAGTFDAANGVMTIRSGDVSVFGNGTSFTSTFTPHQYFKVGSDKFRVSSVVSNTELVLDKTPTRTYFANTFTVETGVTTRQGSGAIRQMEVYRDISTTLDGLLPYFRDTYLRDFPSGVVSANNILPQIIEFYRSRGSEDALKFLFRILFGIEIMKISYPRDFAWTLSDGDWFVPITVKIEANGLTSNGEPADPNLLVSRVITGLTSGARALVSNVVKGYEGQKEVYTLYLEDVEQSTSTDVLVIEHAEDDVLNGGHLMLTAYGIPPDGLPSRIYRHEWVIQTDAQEFIPGEIISTIPVNDPFAIQGELLGSVVGFTLLRGGANYQVGDLIIIPGGFQGGYGARGRVSGLSNTAVSEILVHDGGSGYHAGLSLDVDNSGSGGVGLAGFISYVSPGHILIDDVTTDRLIFTTIQESSGLPTNSYATREIVNYFERGILIENLMNVVIGSADWSSGNSNSALYGVNLTTIISTVLSVTSVFPLYVNGIQPPGGVGKIVPEGITVTSWGTPYPIRAPLVYVDIPRPVTEDSAGTILLDAPNYVFTESDIEASLTPGQIGGVEVLVGGSAYESVSVEILSADDVVWTVSANVADSILPGHYVTANGVVRLVENVSASGLEITVDAPSVDVVGAVLTMGFAIDETSSIPASANARGAVIGITMAAAIRAEGRFLSTKSQLSADRYLQSVERYQPFAYEVASNMDRHLYKDLMERFTHPAGGLLLSDLHQTFELDIDASADVVIDVE